MLEKDYLMRQLMQLFEALQMMVRHRRKGENQQALEDISYFYSILKIDENADKLNIEQFIGFLVEEKKFTNDQLEMIAYVLKEKGEMAESEENRIDLFRKAYFLLEKTERESITFSLDRLMKIGELKEYLN